MAKIASISERKKILIFLSLLAAFCCIFGVLFIRQKINQPFVEEVKQRTLSLEKTKLEKLVALKTKDSDSDGFSDYDELYGYKTSPYLADSDSDGFDDKTEIESGNDPNCVAGQICEQARVSINSNQAAASSTNTVVQSNTEVSPDQIREILRNNGASEAQLSQIDDETLQKLFVETVQETGTNPLDANTAATTGNANAQYQDILDTTTNQATTFEDISNLTPAEIRKLLVTYGVDEATLNQVDDETLQTIYLETLAEQKYATPDATNQAANNNITQ